jgi:hypothetical protein
MDLLAVNDRVFIPCPAVEQASARLRGQPSDLLEEQGCVTAAVPEIADPMHIQWSTVSTALTAHNRPVDTGEVKARQRTQQRLARKEPHRSRNRPENIGPPTVFV